MVNYCVAYLGKVMECEPRLGDYGMVMLFDARRCSAGHGEARVKEQKKLTIICGKCNNEMQEVEIKRYEFEKGIVLDNIKAMCCPEGHITFTEEQVFDMERHTEDIKHNK